MKAPQWRPVVVTGLGTISPVGHHPDQAFENLCRGQSGIRSITRFDTGPCPSKIGGTVEGFKLKEFITDRATLRNARILDQPQQWALCAAQQAMTDAGLETQAMAGKLPFASHRFGVCFGTGLAGRHTFEDMASKLIRICREQGFDDDDHVLDRKIRTQMLAQTNPLDFLGQCPSMASAHIAMRYHAQGANSTIVSLCAAGAQSIGEAAWMIARGDADCMLAGGTDSMLFQTDLAAFAKLDAVSVRNDEPETASRPFDLGRDGCVVGEGAAALVLEPLDQALARGARIYAEIAGYGSTADAYKVSAPPDDGEGAVLSMRQALATAGLQPSDIQHINAHGTSTSLNDRIETLAIKRVFGDHAYNIPVVSTKSMTGHMIAAAGAFEALVSIKSIENQRIPPTINLRTADPNCDLDYSADTSRAMPGLQRVLSNSFAIGGVNTSLIFQGLSTAAAQ